MNQIDATRRVTLHDHWCQRRFRLVVAVWIGLFASSERAHAQLSITPTDQMVLDNDALTMSTSGNFNFVINGSPFQQEALLTHNGYQYSTWYHNGSKQDLYISRRNLAGNAWETIDTGFDMKHGNTNWDAHNVISMGISGDGRIHLSFDHHVDAMRYVTTDAGAATAATWNQSIFKSERSALNQGGSNIPRVTYPRFANVGDDLVLTYRDYGSGNGDVKIADYNSQTGQWSDPGFINKGRGTGQTYNDVTGNASNNRNAYHNGFHTDSTGRLHTTWTWREGTQDGNHDIHYAYSDDKGATWYNNGGALVGTNASPVTLNSPGTEIADLDRRQSIINQQGQIVDSEGGVHALMYHRRQEPGFEWEQGDGRFTHAVDSAYHHYYRDPLTGLWEVRQLPQQPIGARPRLGVDGSGNLFGLYVQSNDLVIVGSEKTAIGYSEWEVLMRDDSRIYDGTPLIDTQRLMDDGILSVFLQERTNPLSSTGPTSGSLRVMEFRVNSPSTIPEPSSLAALLVMAGMLMGRRRRA